MKKTKVSMSRIIYTILFVVSVLAICIGCAYVKDFAIRETMMADGIVVILAMVIYKGVFNEFRE